MTVYSASCSGSHPDGYGTMTLTVSYNTNNENHVSYSLDYSTGYWTTWYGATTTYTIQIHTVSFNGTATTTNMQQNGWQGNLANGTVTVDLSNVEIFSFSFAAGVDNSWGPMVAGAPSGVLQIPASKWTISYQQNGEVAGNPWPENQTVNKGGNIVLSTTSPSTVVIESSQSGNLVTFNNNNGSSGTTSLRPRGQVNTYTFQGWATSPSATSATYQPGATIQNVSANIDLYPVWSKSSVTYDNITLPYASRYGYTFKGWGTSSTATSVVGTGGDSYSATEDITLYAIWEKNTLNGENMKKNILFIKNNGSWSKVKKIYINNSNTWTELSCFFKNSDNWTPSSIELK